jgi:hypothetical protein
MLCDTLAGVRFSGSLLRFPHNWFKKKRMDGGHLAAAEAGSPAKK